MKQLLPLVLCFSAFFCFAAELEEKEAAAALTPLEHEILNPRTRSLLIFLDDTEAYDYDASDKERNHHFRAITHDAFLAIQQKAGPILVSGSILHNLFREPKVYDKHPKALNYFYDTFNPSDWIIRKTNVPEKQLIQKNNVSKKQIAHMYCLIPAEYEGLSKNSLQELKDSDALTELEYNLGLTIEHMKPIPSQSNKTLRDYFDRLYGKYNQNNYSLLKNDTGSSFLQTIHTLFIRNREYRVAEKESPEWIIYLNGHGIYNQTIAALSFEEFKKLVSFLNTNIMMIILVYASCDAAGFNAEKVHGGLFFEKGHVTTFRFPIIILGLPDMDVYGPKTTIHNNIITKTELSYPAFIKNVSINRHDYQNAIVHIVPKIAHKLPIGLLKAAHAPTFLPISVSDKQSINITRAMASTRTKELHIDASINAVLLYTQDVPFPIHGEGKHHVPFISMLPGNAFHTLTILHDDLNNFISAMKTEKYNARKVFLIKTMIENSTPAITELIVDYEPNKEPVFYLTENGKQKTYDYQRKKIVRYQGDYIPQYRDLLLKNTDDTKSILEFSQEYKILNQKILEQHQKKMLQAKITQLLHVRLYPELDFADKRNLRYILERIIKKDPQAITILKDIVENLANDKKQEARDLTQTAYGGSNYWGADFTTTDLEQKKWQDAIIYAIDNADFSFLDAYKPSKQEDKIWQEDQEKLEEYERSIQEELLKPANRASTI